MNNRLLPISILTLLAVAPTTPGTRTSAAANRRLIAREADQVVTDLKAANARVILSLDFPTRSISLAPDADEPGDP